MDQQTHFAEQEVAEVRDRLARRIDRVSAQLSPLGLLSSVVSELHAAERGAAPAKEAAPESPSISRPRPDSLRTSLKNWVIDNPVAAGLATMAVGALVASVVVGRRTSGEPRAEATPGTTAAPTASRVDFGSNHSSHESDSAALTRRNTVQSG